MKKQYRMIIDWVILIKVMENRSFSKAAKELNISISCVSKSITKFEHAFKCQLIRRNAHDFEITTIGKVFYEKAIDIYNAYYSLTTEASNLNKQFTGTIRLSAPSVLCDSLINMWVWEYMKQHPAVNIILNSRESGQFTKDSPEFDDLVLKSGIIESPDLIYKKLNPLSFGLYASPDYLKKNKQILHPHDINELSILKLEHHSITSPLKFMKALTTAESNINDQIVFRSNNINSILALATEGKGISIALPKWKVNKYVEDGVLEQVLTEWKLPALQCNLVWRSRNYYSLMFRDFIYFIENKWNQFFNNDVFS